LSNHVSILCQLISFKNFLGIHTETAAVQQFEAQVSLAVCSWPQENATSYTQIIINSVFFGELDFVLVGTGYLSVPVLIFLNSLFKVLVPLSLVPDRDQYFRWIRIQNPAFVVKN
jgi:hypothetical protein